MPLNLTIDARAECSRPRSRILKQVQQLLLDPYGLQDYSSLAACHVLATDSNDSVNWNYCGITIHCWLKTFGHTDSRLSSKPINVIIGHRSKQASIIRRCYASFTLYDLITMLPGAATIEIYTVKLRELLTWCVSKLPQLYVMDTIYLQFFY